MKDYGERELFRLRDMVHEYFQKQEELWLQAEVDAIHIADDWGTQQSLLISPDMWREYFKPCYREYCEMAHRHGKLVLMHSDGYILDILDDLVEIGVDAVNSQLQCMKLADLERFRGNIAFWREIDRQYLLPFGTSEENRVAVQSIGVDVAAPSGVVLVVDKTTRKEEPPTMPQKQLITNGNVFRRTDSRWQSVIWYFDEQGVKRRKVFSSKTKTEAQRKIAN